MPSISKRDFGNNWNDAGGARWAFFAIFLVLIAIVVLGTLRANRKRSQQGIQPIYGTRWMTPPNYGQSQTQYNQPNDPDIPLNYVPTYTERANEYDMGYYDPNGTFHANPNAKKAPIPEVHPRSTSMSQGVPLSDITSIDDEDLYRPPPGTPPGAPDRVPTVVLPSDAPPSSSQRSRRQNSNSASNDSTMNGIIIYNSTINNSAPPPPPPI